MVFIATFVVLGAVCAGISYIQRNAGAAAVAQAAPADKDATKVDDPTSSVSDVAFKRFQMVYLAVYLLMMGTGAAVRRAAKRTGALLTSPARARLGIGGGAQCSGRLAAGPVRVRALPAVQL